MCSAQFGILVVVEHSRKSRRSQDSVRSANTVVPNVNIGEEGWMKERVRGDGDSGESSHLLPSAEISVPGNVLSV